MSCIDLEITSGTAWGLINSRTAGKCATVFSTELSAALCLFIHCCPPPSRFTTAADMPSKAIGPWIYKSCIPPLPVSFADPWLAVGLSQGKAISLTAWLLFQANADLPRTLRLPALPLGYSGNRGWYRAACLPFVPTPGCVATKRKKKLGA